MGFYIEVPEHKQKAEQIRDIYGGEIVNYDRAKEAMADPEIGVIVVLDNLFFEAAGFAFDEREFQEFTDFVHDDRARKYVLLPRKKAEELSRFPHYIPVADES